MVLPAATTWPRAALLGVALACGCGDSTPAADDAGIPLPDASTPDAPKDTGADRAIDASGDGAGSCIDNLRNGAETDIDCGGNCPACGDGRDCLVDTDCQVGTCFRGSARRARGWSSPTETTCPCPGP